MPFALVITGPACAGKSTLAQSLQTKLRWPLLAKDAFKETLFDELGWSDRAWSKRISGASYGLMFAIARQLLASGHHCMLEGNFRWSENGARFAELQQLQNVRWVQLFCTASAEVLSRRFDARIASGTRHPGHVDEVSQAEIKAEQRLQPMRKLPLAGTVLEFDSATADSGAYERLIDEICGLVRDA